MSYLNVIDDKFAGSNGEVVAPSKEDGELVKLYQASVKKACKLLNSKNAYIFFVSEGKKHISVKAAIGKPFDNIPPEKNILVKDYELQYVLRVTNPIIIESVSDIDATADETNIFTPPMLVFPINVNESTLGFLIVCNKKDKKKYDDDDLTIAGLIVSHIVSKKISIDYLRERDSLISELNEVRIKHLKLYENSNVSFFWVAQDGKIMDVNQSTLDILGYTKQDILNMKFKNIVKDAHLGYHKVRKMRKSFDELTLIKNNGDLINVEISLNRVSLNSNVFYLGAARDITEKKKLEQLIKESRYKFLTIIDGIKDGILLLDKDLNILAINKEQARRSNISAIDAVGKKCFEVVHSRSNICDTTECAIKDALLSNSVVKKLLVSTNKAGEKEYLEITTFPLFDYKDELYQVVAVLRDVTKEKNLQHQLVYSEKLATLGTLSAKIGHEIRNPLTAILTCAQFLEMKDRENKSIKIIISEGSRIQSMVNDLLTISMPKAPTESLIFLEKSLEDVIYFLKNITGQIKYHDIVKEFSDIPPVIGDEDQIKQLFTNLILNASQAMEASGKKESQLIIGTTLSEDNKYSLTYITDCGEGIKKEDIKKIFDPFYTTKGSKGTGLGMAVVKEIIDSHNGKIEVESEVGKFTTMKVYLPISVE